MAWVRTASSTGRRVSANRGEVHFGTEADAAPVEYAPRGQRPFSGADLAVAGDSWWRFDGEESTVDTLWIAFLDEVNGVRAVLCYRAEPSTDVLCRWAELTNTGSVAIEIDRLGSAGVCVPTGPSGARLTYLIGQWLREFTRRTTVLPAGGFRMESRFGVPGRRTCRGSRCRARQPTTAPRTGFPWPGRVRGR